MELKKQLEKSFTPVKDGVTVSEGNVYDDNLPDGITVKAVKDLNKYTKDFIATAHEVAGIKALEAMKKDDKLDTVTASIPLGCFGEQTSSYQRSAETFNPQTKEKMTVLGKSRAIIDYHAGASGKSYNQAKRLVREEAEKIFGK